MLPRPGLPLDVFSSNHFEIAREIVVFREKDEVVARPTRRGHDETIATEEAHRSSNLLATLMLKASIRVFFDPKDRQVANLQAQRALC